MPRLDRAAAAVWYEEADPAPDIAGVMDGVDALLTAKVNDADAMLSRDRTRSRGYVVHTDVTPARAPATRRVGVSNGRAPLFVKNVFSCS